MRADRLLSILLLLQVRRRVTARELARKLEVSQRTIYRDMDALSAAGVPVVAERGADGGWSLVEGYETKLTGLNVPEVWALFVSRPTGVLEDLGLGHAAEDALLKLIAALPTPSRRDAEDARQRFYVDAPGWSCAKESSNALPELQTAVWEDRRVRFFYERPGCEPIERVGDALGLVSKGSAWYLVASVDGEVRSYRASRMLSVVMTDETFERPRGFDLAAFWRESMRSFKEHLPSYHVTALVGPSGLPRLRMLPPWIRIERESAPGADGRVEVVLRFDVEDEACRWALGMGAAVEIVEPARLRELVVEQARALVALYTGRSVTSGARH